MTARIRLFAALLFVAAIPGWSQTSTAGAVVGQITGQANTPRNMEFGLRVRF